MHLCGQHQFTERFKGHTNCYMVFRLGSQNWEQSTLFHWSGRGRCPPQTGNLIYSHTKVGLFWIDSFHLYGHGPIGQVSQQKFHPNIDKVGFNHHFSFWFAVDSAFHRPTIFCRVPEILRQQCRY